MSTTPRVFAVQQPTQRDPITGAISPSMDLTPALQFGQLRFVLREFTNPFRDLDAVANEVERVFDEEGFNENDWLLLIGNPILIGVTAAIAAQYTGRLKMLQWHRVNHEYRPAEVQIFPLEDTHAVA